LNRDRPSYPTRRSSDLRGFPEKLVREIIDVATEGLKPDMTLFFDLPADKAIGRMDRRRGSQTNRMDAEGEAFYTRVREAYLAIAAAEPERFRTIDADRPIGAIHADVRAHIEELLGN